MRRWRMSIAAYPAAGRAVHRALFAQALPRLAKRRVPINRHPRAPALARAIDAITGRGIEPAEAEWIERIGAYRNAFAARGEKVESPFPGGVLRGPVSTRQLANVSSVAEPWGRFLLRLVRELRPQSCIELGTAVGISAAYQGAGLELNGTGRLTSIDRSEPLVELAREALAELRIERVEMIAGEFDDVLEDALVAVAPVEMAFLDAGKRREDNLRQFQRVLPHLAPGAVVVMDDIHWSRDMGSAWRWIRSQEQVQVSVDLWRLGVCLVA